MGLLVEENYINATRGWRIGDSGIQESFADTPGELFHYAVRECGRCISSIYIDTNDGGVKRIGWVFEKRKQYDDCNDTFLLETWVTIHDRKPERTITHYYHELRS